jgi:hypothetical protein
MSEEPMKIRALLTRKGDPAYNARLSLFPPSSSLSFIEAYKVVKVESGESLEPMKEASLMRPFTIIH